MNLPKVFRVLVTMGVLIVINASPLPAAEAKKDAQTLINEMRLKRWTKELELNEEQKKKVQVILDEEGKEVGKLNENTNITVTERKVKIDELRAATYGKVKPLLSAAQAQAFEKLLPKSKKKN